MIRFFKGLKRAADFFSIHPEGLSFVTERRLKDLEASVNRLPKAIEDRNLTRMINLEHQIYEVEQTINSLQNKGKEQIATQLALPVKKGISLKEFREYWETRPHKKLVPSKPKPVKLQAVEEEVKKVKSKLTQAKVKRLFEYRDGELYWKVDRVRAKKGDKAGATKRYKHIFIEGRYYTCGRIIFLMFHGYLPEYVSYIDGNSLNTRIENLREATASQIRCNAKRGINNTSGFKGVVFNKQVGKYKAAIVKKKKFYHLGYFDTAEEAHKAYRKAAKKLHGEFARVA